jgi:hypothetical protein
MTAHLAPLPGTISDPLRLGVSDNEGLNLWIGYGAIYVKGGQQS